jgi:hypothetical protein
MTELKAEIEKVKETYESGNHNAAKLELSIMTITALNEIVARLGKLEDSLNLINGAIVDKQ